jgi:glycosyltransferase involved in cell wall biosynthesis
VEQKGQKYLIEIARILQSMDIDFRVLVAGEGPLLSPLKQMAASAGVKNHFVFLGFVDSIRNFMRTIDIFVLPSLWEGFGYVLVEAMACAKPVIAFDLSSNPEIIEHGKTGYLVNRDNISGLAQKTADLCRDPVLRQRMGIAGRERAEKLFGVEQSHSKVEELLMRLTRNGLTYQSL